MEPTTRITNLGVEISFGGAAPQPLKPAADADQKNPRRSYVYAHVDDTGKFFYIGQGQGQRAWSKERHPA